MKRALIIEDDEILRKTWKRFLKRMVTPPSGAAIDMTDNAKRAIELLGTYNYDVIVCDFQLLGRESGGYVYEWVRDNKPTLLPSFFFCTGVPNEVRSLYKEAQFIAKPFMPEDLKVVQESLAPNGPSTPS